MASLALQCLMDTEQLKKKRSNSIKQENDSGVACNFYTESKANAKSRAQQQNNIKNMMLSSKVSQKVSQTLQFKSEQMVKQSASLQEVLRELSQTSPNQIKKEKLLKFGNIKKTPSTSLHTPADFTTKRLMNQSLKVVESGPSLQNSSRIQQLTKRKAWIDLINDINAQQILNDQRAENEYTGVLSTQAGFITDFNAPYYIPEKQYNNNKQTTTCKELIYNIQQHDFSQFAKWKQSLIQAKFRS